MNEKKVVFVVGEECGTDLASGGRNQHIVQQCGQLGAPPTLPLGNCSNDLRGGHPIAERRRDHPARAFHRVNELPDEGLGPAIPRAHPQLVGNDRGEVGRRGQGKERLAKPGALVFGGNGTQVDVRVQEVFQRYTVRKRPSLRSLSRDSSISRSSTAFRSAC